MEYTTKNIEEILTNMGQLNDLAQKFVNDGDPWKTATARINFENFSIEVEKCCL